MKQYLNLMQKVLDEGEERGDRTGTGTISLFGEKMEFDLRQGFPLLTTKKLHIKSIVHELLWFIRGDTNTKYLRDNGVTIWDEWSDEKGNLGPVYGEQWRGWYQFTGTKMSPYGEIYVEHNHIDQLQNVIDSIKNNPYSRRHIVSAWNVGELDKMALPPCHMMFQFYCTTDGYLDLQLYQRSCDIFLGVPYNIASYSLLLSMVAKITGRKPRKFIWVGGDVHLYSNHIKQAKEQLKRPTYVHKLPTLYLKYGLKNIDDFKYEHINIVDYKAYPHIKAPVAI